MRESHKYIVNKIGKTAVTMAEVGAGRGDHAMEYCKLYNISKLYLIENDAWQLDSLQRLQEFAKMRSNFEVISKSSVEAAKEIQEQALDIVYIDANHSYESVKEDIQSWYPKLKKGSFLVLHDFCNGVEKAAREHVEANRIDIIVFPNQAQAEAILRKG